MWARSSITLVNAAVLDGDGGCHPSLRIEGRLVHGLGVDPRRGDTVIDVEGAVVLPGLVNAHDHLELNALPRLKWRERHRNVREWIADFQPRFGTEASLASLRAMEMADRLWVGGLKNLLSGVTTVCHHNPLHAPLRRRFPVRVVRHYGFSHSLQIDGADLLRAEYRRTPRDWPWIVHAAEGIDEEAESEVGRLDALGCLGANSVLVHGVAVRERAPRVIGAGAALVWCPTSNDFLFGATADVGPFAQARRLAIGSDSRLSGEGDLLDELRGAHRTGQCSAEALVRAVTSGAADILRLPDAGRLRPGASADVTVIRASGDDPYDAVVAASRRDVLLAMIDGQPLVSAKAFRSAFDAARTPAVPVEVDGSPRLLSRWVARRTSYATVAERGLAVSPC
jgi:cytosine/adenosine deaminase-related metal-dependent hydrolase